MFNQWHTNTTNWVSETEMRMQFIVLSSSAVAVWKNSIVGLYGVLKLVIAACVDSKMPIAISFPALSASRADRLQLQETWIPYTTYDISC